MLKLKFRLLKDNLSLYVIMFLMSLLLASVLGNTSGGDGNGVIAVVDQSKRVATAEVIHALEREGNFEVKLMELEEGEQAVINHQVIFMIVFDDTATIYEIKPTTERYQAERLIRENKVADKADETFIEKAASIIEVKNGQPVNHMALADGLKSALRSAEEAQEVYTIERAYYDASPQSNYDPKIHATVGMTLFFVTYSLMFTVGDYLEDRRLHTLDRMLVSPISRYTILIGNVLPAFVLGSFQTALMIVTGRYLFGIKWGTQIGGIILIAMLYVFAMTALSFLVVSLVKNMSQLGAISPIILTGMGMLGGCMWPLEIIKSRVLLKMADLTPHRWAISAIESLIARGHFTSSIYSSMAILLLMGLSYIILGGHLLKLKRQV